MRVLQGTNYGCSKNSLLLIYKSLIQSQLDYSALVYSVASKSQLDRLDVIQGKALRLALRALPCTPLSVLCVEAGVAPLHIRREEQSLRYWARVGTRAGKRIPWDTLVSSIPVISFIYTHQASRGKLPRQARILLGGYLVILSWRVLPLQSAEASPLGIPWTGPL